jgi:hypothetical protein
VKFDGASQPSVIIADGFSGGGEFGKGRIKAFGINPYFGFDKDGFVLDSVLDVIKPYPDAIQVVFVTQPFPRRTPEVAARPMFVHDDESKTAEQLENFVRREMALLQHRSLVAHYTVTGHVQDGKVWTVDTVVDVDDEISGVQERMYVLSRTFNKSRQGGTTTDLELVRLGSIDFGKPSSDVTKSANLKANPDESETTSHIRIQPEGDAFKSGTKRADRTESVYDPGDIEPQGKI